MSGPWFAGYDAWKLATPPEYEQPDTEDDLFHCYACEDVGWLDDEGHAVPCTECSEEVDPLADEWIGAWL